MTLMLLGRQPSLSKALVLQYGVETTFQGGITTAVEGLIIRGYLTGTSGNGTGIPLALETEVSSTGKASISSGRSLITDGGDIYVRDGIFKPWTTDLTEKTLPTYRFREW